jgi:hypothetical protein
MASARPRLAALDRINIPRYKKYIVFYFFCLAEVFGMKKFIALMVITGFLVVTAPPVFAENGGVQPPWYNPSSPQSVPEVPVVTPPTPGHPPVEAAGGTFLSGPVMIGLGVAALGAVALAVGGSSGGSTPAATNH